MKNNKQEDPNKRADGSSEIFYQKNKRGEKRTFLCFFESLNMFDLWNMLMGQVTYKVVPPQL